MEPSGIAVNKLGEIFVADRELNGVMKLSDSLQMISFAMVDAEVT